MGWKSPQDREAYITKMKSSGVFTPEEIDAEVNAIDNEQQPQATPQPPPVKASSAMGGGGSPLTTENAQPSALAPSAAEVQSNLKDLSQARIDQHNALSDQVFNTETAKLVGYPLAGYGAYKLLGAAANATGITDKLSKLKDRMFTPSPEINRNIDIPMEAAPTQEGKLPAAAQQPKLSAQDQALLEASQRNAPIRQEYMSRMGNMAPPAAPGLIPSTTNITTTPVGVAPPVASEFTVAPVTPAPVVETTTPVAETPKVEPAKQPVKPPAKAPKSKVEMPEGWGKGMSWLTTVHGPEGAQAFIDQYNNGKPFATHQEMEKVYKEVTVRPKYSDIPKDIRKERGIIPRAALSPIPPPSLQAAPQMGGGGGGSLIRGLTDPLQLKQ